MEEFVFYLYSFVEKALGWRVGSDEAPEGDHELGKFRFKTPPPHQAGSGPRVLVANRTAGDCLSPPPALPTAD